MLLKYHFLKLLIIFTHWEKSSSKICSLFDIVTNHLKLDSQIRQILIFANKTDNLREINKFRSTPTIVVDNRNLTDARALDLQLRLQFQNSRSTLYVVLSTGSSDSLISKHLKIINFINFTNFITKICSEKIRPKVLLVEDVELNQRHKELLKLMWAKHFLDVTILELSDGKKEPNHFSPVNEKQIAKQQFYIPFQNKFVKTNASLKQNLFPDKLKNLHGFPFAVGFYNVQLFVIPLRNATGQVTNVHGPDAELVKLLATVKNFRLDIHFSEKGAWDLTDCVKEKNKGLVYDLMNNSIRLIGCHSVKPLGCFEKLMQMVQNHEPMNYYAMVPIFMKESSTILGKWKILNVIIFFSLITLVLIVTRLLRFNSKCWQTLEVIKMALGMSMLYEAKSLVERIVMGTMLITFFFYSSDIYSTFTHAVIPATPTATLNTLEELYSSDLVLQIHPNMYSALADNNGINAVKFFQRAVRMPIIPEECTKTMVKLKNITCIMQSHLVSMQVRDARIKYKNSFIKAIKETVITQPGFLLFEPGSPYVQSFGHVFLKITEAGFFLKWNKKYFGDDDGTLIEKVTTETSDLETKLTESIVSVFVVGYTCSTVVFIGELIYHYVQESLTNNKVVNFDEPLTPLRPFRVCRH